MLTKEQYNMSEKKQTLHRSLNTVLTLCVLVFGFMFVKNEVTPLYEDIIGITEQRQIKKDIVSEIENIGNDEGYRRCVYNDSLGIPTIGWGHRMLPEDDFECIDTHYAVQLLRKDYSHAQADVDRRYPWATGEVRLVLINMTFNMGSNGLSKFKKTLSYLKDKKYDMAAGELLDSKYARTLPRRASSMAVRIMRLQE